MDEDYLLWISIPLVHRSSMPLSSMPCVVVVVVVDFFFFFSLWHSLIR